VLNLPPTYVAGVQVLYRSVVAGTDPVVLTGTFAEARWEIGGRSYVSVVPTQLHRLLDDAAETSALAAFDSVLVGGAAFDPALRSRAEAAGVRVTSTYGMSETCGGCVYDGVPLAGVELRIDDADRVLLRGPMLFDGYQDDPALTASAMEDGWFVTHDVGALADGRLRITGRDDDVVVSGGLKVPAPAVAERVRSHPGVRAAEVLGVPDAEWGQRVVAFVVGDVALEPLREWVADEHPRPWAPRQLVTIDAIPLLDNGKVDRVRLRGLA
jgi:O-succinylbenzoic acid--CoA ligase